MTFTVESFGAPAEEVPHASFYVGVGDAMTEVGDRKRYSGGVFTALSFIELRHSRGRKVVMVFTLDIDQRPRRLSPPIDFTRLSSVYFKKTYFKNAYNISNYYYYYLFFYLKLNVIIEIILVYLGYRYILNIEFKMALLFLCYSIHQNRRGVGKFD